MFNCLFIIVFLLFALHGIFSCTILSTSGIPFNPTNFHIVILGDCIQTISGQEKVTSVETAKGEGVYTVVTNEEFIVVNGIIASSFGANHMMANLFYNIHRFIYAISPSFLTSSLLHSANEGLGLMIPFFGPSNKL